eukprot:EG_transcript_6574
MRLCNVLLLVVLLATGILLSSLSLTRRPLGAPIRLTDTLVAAASDATSDSRRSSPPPPAAATGTDGGDTFIPNELATNVNGSGRGSKHSPLNIAILSLYVGVPIIPKKLYAAVHSKRCYAALHGYSFILDTSPRTHKRMPHWNRVLVLQRYLPQFDWILYLDIDTMMVNASITLEHFLLSPYITPDVHLILSEGDHVNSGGFFLRNSSWGMRFLRDWWEYGTPEKAPYQEQYDQGALVFLLLDHLNADVNGSYDKSCHRGAMGGAEKCWLRWMDRLGLPLNRRLGKNIIWWPCNASTVRGFNFYGHGCWLRHPCQCYRNGDLLAHTHALGEWNVGFTETYCPVPWTTYLHVELGLRNPEVEALKQDRRRQMQEYEQAYATHRVVHSYWFKGQPYLYVLLDLNGDASSLQRTVTLKGHEHIVANGPRTTHEQTSLYANTDGSFFFFFMFSEPQFAFFFVFILCIIIIVGWITNAKNFVAIEALQCHALEYVSEVKQTWDLVWTGVPLLQCPFCNLPTLFRRYPRYPILFGAMLLFLLK